MNITVSPVKESSKKKDSCEEEKLIWDETDKETGENPLDRLCQLLRIDEEEGKDKRYVFTFFKSDQTKSFFVKKKYVYLNHFNLKSSSCNCPQAER